MMKKRFLTVVMALLMVSAFFAEETVSVYTTLEEPFAKALFDLYKTKTGVSVNFIRLSGGEVIARLEAEKDNPQASLWVGGVGLDHITAKSKGLTESYKSRFAGNTPEQYRDSENYWIGLYLGPLTFVTNTERAKALGLPVPTSWADLLKPIYKGQIRVASPLTSGTAYNLITTQRYLFNGDEEKAFDYLRKLDANIDQYTKSGSAPGKSVAIGEIPIAIGYAHDQVKLKVDGKAPVVITAPSEGTGYELASMSMIKGGKQAVEAKKLYDWILGKEAQDIVASWYVVPVSKIAVPNPSAFKITDIKTVNQDIRWDGDKANSDRLKDRWNAEIGSKR
jgi:iron(III) transport system substrate-binding protein